MSPGAGEDQALRCLDGKLSGSFLIETEASWHVVDLYNRTITRIWFGERELDPAHLRQDNKPIGLLFLRASLGRGMIQLLDLYGDGTPVTRFSTDVVRIRPLSRE